MEFYRKGIKMDQKILTGVLASLLLSTSSVLAADADKQQDLGGAGMPGQEHVVPPAEEAQPEAKEEAQPEAKEEAQPEAKEEAQPEAKEEAQPEAKEEAQPEAKEEAQPEAKEEAQPEAKEEEIPAVGATKKEDGKNFRWNGTAWRRM